ncbi:MAG: hypothetical protein D3910_15305, partial [Candidatus Electrothrix sp. ATG2]|nr:hypothetical protein [Candidatus Electrothrix sp. ATG2]
GHGQLLIAILITQEKRSASLQRKTADRKQVWYYSREKKKSQTGRVFFGNFAVIEKNETAGEK